jgi:hypothetical protein
MSTDVFEIRIGQNVNMYNDFEAGFLINYRKIKFYTAKINDIWTKNEINNNNNHKAS